MSSASGVFLRKVYFTLPKPSAEGSRNFEISTGCQIAFAQPALSSTSFCVSHIFLCVKPAPMCILFLHAYLKPHRTEHPSWFEIGRLLGFWLQSCGRAQVSSAKKADNLTATIRPCNFMRRVSGWYDEELMGRPKFGMLQRFCHISRYERLQACPIRVVLPISGQLRSNGVIVCGLHVDAGGAH